jgi:hypothetical protein
MRCDLGSGHHGGKCEKSLGGAGIPVKFPTLAKSPGRCPNGHKKRPFGTMLPKCFRAGGVNFLRWPYFDKK